MLLSHIPEDEWSSTTGVFKVQPSPQHDTATGDKHTFVSMNPVVILVEGPVLVLVLVHLLADAKTYASPACESTVRKGNRLGKAKQRVCSLAAAVSLLRTFKVRDALCTFISGYDTVAFIWPYCL